MIVIGLGYAAGASFIFAIAYWLLFWRLANKTLDVAGLCGPPVFAGLLTIPILAMWFFA